MSIFKNTFVVCISLLVLEVGTAADFKVESVLGLPSKSPTTASDQKSLSSDVVTEFFYGYCGISQPGQRDRSGRYCDGTYGVLYDGFIMDNSCYYNIQDAYNKSQSMKTCQIAPPAQAGYCRLVHPNQRDGQGSYCENSHSFTYLGYLAKQVCYNAVDTALDLMFNSYACYQQPVKGACRILVPGQRDNANRYCDKTWGVTYNGYIINNTCFYDAGDATKAMNSYGFCY